MPTPFDPAILPTDATTFKSVVDYRNTVIERGDGREKRIIRHKWALNRFVLNKNLSPLEAMKLAKFVVARRGSYRSFRMQDWTDYSTTNSDDVGYAANDSLLIRDSSTQYHLTKTYAVDGLPSKIRRLYKPKNGFVRIQVNGTLLSVESGAWSVNYETGRVTFTDPLDVSAIVRGGAEFDKVVRFSEEVDQFLPINIANWGQRAFNNLSLVEVAFDPSWETVSTTPGAPEIPVESPIVVPGPGGSLLPGAICNIYTGTCRSGVSTSISADEVFMGAGTTCAGVDCEAEVIGAICNTLTGACRMGTADSLGVNEEYMGDGVLCENADCGSLALGAICNTATNECRVGHVSSVGVDEVYQDDGTTCIEVDCSTPTGSCKCGMRKYIGIQFTFSGATGIYAGWNGTTPTYHGYDELAYDPYGPNGTAPTMPVGQNGGQGCGSDIIEPLGDASIATGDPAKPLSSGSRWNVNEIYFQSNSNLLPNYKWKSTCPLIGTSGTLEPDSAFGPLPYYSEEEEAEEGQPEPEGGWAPPSSYPTLVTWQLIFEE